jgi:hypothetical protein
VYGIIRGEERESGLACKWWEENVFGVGTWSRELIIKNDIYI